MNNLRSNFNSTGVGYILLTLHLKSPVTYLKFKETISKASSKTPNENTSCSYGLNLILSKTSNNTKKTKFHLKFPSFLTMD